MRKSFLCMMLLALVSWYASAQQPQGVYKYTNQNRITEAKFTLRKEGNLKADFKNRSKETSVVVFSPVKGSGSPQAYALDVNENGKEIWQIEALSEKVVVIKVINRARLVTQKIYFAKSNRELKKYYKNPRGVGSLNPFKRNTRSNRGNRNDPRRRTGPPKVWEFMAENPTSAFHAKNVGKIIFFAEKPTINSEAPRNIKTRFKAGEPVWAVAYLPTKLKNMKNIHNEFVDNFRNASYNLYIGLDKVDAELSEQEKPIVNSCNVKSLSRADLEKNYVIFQVIPPADINTWDAKEGVVAADFMAKRLAKRVGKFKYTLEVCLTNAQKASSGKRTHPELVNEGIEIFCGQFEYDATGGTDQYANLSKQVAQKKLQAKRLPDPVRRDPALEAEILQQIQLYANRRGWQGKWVKAIINVDWQIIKDKYNGQIKGKFIGAYGCYKENENGECGYIEFGFLKEYQGNGQYSDNIRQYSLGNQRGQVSCDKL